MFENGKKYLRFKNNIDDLIMNSKEAIFEMNNFKYFDMSAWGKIYKTDLFNNIKFPEGKLSEDYFIMYLLFDKANKIVYNSKPLYYYLQRNGSITKGKKIKLDFVEAAYNQMIYIENKYPDLKRCVRAAYASANMTVYNIVLKNKGEHNKEILKKLQYEVKINYNYIKGYKQWSIPKRIQAFLFIRYIPVYNFVFKIFRIIKKV